MAAGQAMQINIINAINVITSKKAVHNGSRAGNLSLQQPWVN